MKRQELNNRIADALESVDIHIGAEPGRFIAAMVISAMELAYRQNGENDKRIAAHRAFNLLDAPCFESYPLSPM